MNNNVGNNSTSSLGMVYCARCGAPFNPKSRYCMKCGNINPDHPDNKNMSKYIKKNGSEGYRIGSGKKLINRKNNVLGVKGANSVEGDRTGSFSICFAVNMVFYLVLSVGTLLYYLLLARGNFGVVVSSNISIYLLVYALIFFYIFCLESIFIKLNRRWWFALIPIVNMCVLVEAVTSNYKLALFSLVPGIGQLIWLYSLYKLGQSFEKSGILTVVCPFIMIPVIAFGGSSFHWTYFVSKNSTVEKDYLYKKVFGTLILLFVATSVVFILYTRNVEFINEAGRLDKAYLMRASEIAINDAVQKVSTGNYSCDFNMDEFYFHYEDINDHYNVPFSMFFSPVEAYIRVEKVKEDGAIVLGEYNYYISASDGNIGYEEVSTKDLKYKVIKDDFKKISDDYENGNHCYLDYKKS